jgi:hypothetical protein
MTWPKLLAFSAAASILIGTVVLRSSFLNGASENWRPVYLPLPPLAMSVSEPFQLASGGEFQIQLETSATTAEQAALHREGPPVEMFITYEISGPEGFRITQSITQMTLSSWSSDTDIYTAGMVTLPRGGDYHVLFHGGKRAALFTERGGVIQFERVAPSGYGLLYPVLNGFAYLCFLFASASILFIANRCVAPGPT